MPSDIVETPVFGSAISAPIGADVRNANSVRVPFQSVGNRLKFLENFYTLMKVFLQGGTLAPTGTLIWDLASGGITFNGDSDFAINLNSGVNVNVNARNFRGPITGVTGTDGRVPRRVQRVTPASNTVVNPTLVDVLLVDPSAPIEVKIAPTVKVDGDWIRVVNLSTTHIVTLVDELSSTSLKAITPRTGGDLPWAEAAWAATPGAWYVIGVGK
jgi:hypothetical protein